MARKRIPLVLLILVVLVIFPVSRALAGSRDIAVIRPGGPSSSDQAQEQISSLVKQIAKKAGWAEDSVSGRYFNEEAAGLAYVKSKKCGFVLTTPGFYLKHHEDLGLTAVNQVRIRGRSDSRYFVVARKGVLAGLADLKGKTLSGALLAEPEFIERVVFERAVVFGTDVKIKEARTLRALRMLDAGEVDAVVLDEKEAEGLKELPFASSLVTVFASKPIPNTGFMAVKGNAAAADIGALASAARDFLSTEGGAEICKNFDITDFTPIQDSVFAGMCALYQRK